MGCICVRPPRLHLEAVASITHLIETGAIHPPIGAEYPLSEVATAIADLGSRRAARKVVVTLK